MPRKSTSIPVFLKPSLRGIALVVALLATCGVLLVWRFAALDLARDMKSWQDKLNLIADSRASAVGEWVETHMTEVRKLADNPSLQLYFTEISARGAQQEIEPAQKTYLRNLLTFTADRAGFAPEQPPMSVQIPAQIPYSAQSGIAVLDAQGDIAVSTAYLTALEPRVRDLVSRLPAGEPGILDIFRNEKGVSQIGFTAPVRGIQADPAEGGPIGRVVGIRRVDEALARLLKHPGVTEKTLEAALVRREGDNLVYLSPLADGTEPLDKQLKADPGQLAEALAVDSPGKFVAEGRDYQSRSVMETARAVPGTPWFVVVKVNRSEALAESQARRGGMVLLLFTLLAFVVAVVVAVWHSASSRRALLASKHFKELASRARAQERLLSLVSDTQPDAVYIVDAEHQYRFANASAAAGVSMNAEDMLGKPVEDVLGAARAADIVAACDEALAEGKALLRTRREHVDGQETVVQTGYVPLAHIPVPGVQENTPGVLVIEQDISEAVHEREKRIDAQRELIDTLVGMVDLRDPNAANHSHLVANIAEGVAEALELEEHLCEAARLAGSLMNIGKLVVPEHVLTKRDALKDEELKTIRHSLSLSADVLRDIQFEGPVAETLRQAQEQWDGSGPRKLKGEEILITARIIAVVNAFVAMISQRSYRAALPLDDAFKDLMDKAGTQFDRKVAIALINYMENQGGAAVLKQLEKSRKKAA